MRLPMPRIHNPLHGPFPLAAMLLAALLALAPMSPGFADEAAATPSAAATAAEPPAAPASTPAAAPAFDAEAATEAYLAQLSPEARARSDAYFEGGYWLQGWDFLIGLALAGALLASGLSARMRDLAARISSRRWLQTALYGLQYFLLTTLVLLPWAAYEGYFREHQYGMSNQTLTEWLVDQGKGLAITLLLGTLALVALYAVVRKAGRTWWLWGALVAVGFIVFSAAIGPTYLEPVFNKFYPLADSPLKQQVLSMARANGIPATDVFEFDASKQTTKMSAHVSGLLGSARISLNDNLMNRGSPAEVLSVLGHEMGHYVLNHVYKGIGFFAVIVMGGFALIAWSFERIIRGVGRGWGIREVGDPAGLPLVIALFSIYGFVLTPVQNTVTRTMEAEADMFGLNAAREPDGFAQAALHLSEYRKMRPGPIEEVLFYDHPSGWNRIHRAMIWKAENPDAGKASRQLPEPAPAAAAAPGSTPATAPAAAPASEPSPAS